MTKNQGTKICALKDISKGIATILFISCMTKKQGTKICALKDISKGIAPASCTEAIRAMLSRCKPAHKVFRLKQRLNVESHCYQSLTELQQVGAIK